MRRVLSLVLVLSAVTAPDLSGQSADPADIARAFFTAYAAGDVAHATSYWTPGAAAMSI